jgi:hypothetical protein
MISYGVAAVAGIGLCVALGFLFVGGVFALTRPVVDASENFLAQLGRGELAEAYAAAADGLRARQDEASFVGAVEQLGLTEYARASWTRRGIENQEGSAEGTVFTKGGVAKPIALQLVREGGRWAVVGVRYGGVDLATVQASPAVPPGPERERLVAESLLGFNGAVRARDFTAFYRTLSELWKKETTPKQLQQTFQVFLDRDIDIGPVKDLKPRIARASVNDRGVLAVAGHYPTRPSRVQFDMEYVRESGAWKLSGITVNVGKEVAAD